MNKPKPPSAEEGAYKGDVTPEVAWNILESEPSANLVDVRTDAEMLYVGMPVLDTLGKDVHVAPWVLFPGGDANPEFIVQPELPLNGQSALCKENKIHNLI